MIKLNTSKDLSLTFLFFIYGTIIVSVYSDLLQFAALFLMLSVYIFGAFKFPKSVILFPFIIYPFMFVIRAQGPEYLFVKLIPDIFTIVAIILHIAKNGISTRHYQIFLILAFHSLMTLLICIFHLNDSNYLFVLVRQFTLPIVFLIIFINAAEKNIYLPLAALKLSIISFSIIGIIALLNITKIVQVEPSIEALYPFLNFSPESSNGDQIIGRKLTDSLILPRLNLLTGGALGSSAAIFCALGFVCIYFLKVYKKFMYFFLSIFLLISGLLTLSTSILISIICSIFVFAPKKTRIFIIMLSFPFFGFLLSKSEIFIGETPLGYLANSSIVGFLKFISELSITQILFGVGPRIVSEGYLFVPNLFIIDVGLFRVFVETGILNFLLFLIFILIVFWRGFVCLVSSSSVYVKPYFYIFLVFILLVHANVAMLPPFFPLFTVAVAGIFCAFSIRSSTE